MRANLADAYQSAGRTAEAIALHESASRAYESKLGPDHPKTLVSPVNLAGAYRSLAEPPKPSSCMRRRLRD